MQLYAYISHNGKYFQKMFMHKTGSQNNLCQCWIWIRHFALCSVKSFPCFSLNTETDLTPY